MQAGSWIPAVFDNGAKARQIDIGAAVGVLCCNVEGPTERDWNDVKRVM